MFTPFLSASTLIEVLFFPSRFIKLAIRRGKVFFADQVGGKGKKTVEYRWMTWVLALQDKQGRGWSRGLGLHWITGSKRNESNKIEQRNIHLVWIKTQHSALHPLISSAPLTRHQHNILWTLLGRLPWHWFMVGTTSDVVAIVEVMLWDTIQSDSHLVTSILIQLSLHHDSNGGVHNHLAHADRLPVCLSCGALFASLLLIHSTSVPQECKALFSSCPDASILSFFLFPISSLSAL